MHEPTAADEEPDAAPETADRAAVGALARATLSRADETRSTAERLRSAPERLRERAREQHAELHRRAVAARLKDAPLDKLREAAGGRIRFDALERAGYRDVRQVLSARSEQLRRHPGVGEKTAEATVDELGDSIDALSAELDSVRPMAGRAGSKLRMMFAGRAKKQASLRALARLEDLLEQPWVERSTDAARRAYEVAGRQNAADGVGLSTQSASVVILAEPQLKPSTEEQAIARCHRMGQTRKVHVHRQIAKVTVDQRLAEVLEGKTRLFDAYARDSAAENSDDSAVDTEPIDQRLLHDETIPMGQRIVRV
ncbi:hypothetical protein J2S53_001567 [Actinopolyspora lacussalsi]|nr:hypothetical protein [Actinopolyspora lacussalsi]